MAVEKSPAVWGVVRGSDAHWQNKNWGDRQQQTNNEWPHNTTWISIAPASTVYIRISASRCAQWCWRNQIKFDYLSIRKMVSTALSVCMRVAPVGGGGGESQREGEDEVSYCNVIILLFDIYFWMALSWAWKPPIQYCVDWVHGSLTHSHTGKWRRRRRRRTN